MGFLDSIGGVANRLGGTDKLVGMAQGLLEQAGGVDGLVAKFQGAGAGDQAKSWVGTGQNQAVTADQVTTALGDQEVEQVAQQAGVSKQEAAGGLAAALPGLIDSLTPGGKVPDLDAIKGGLGKLLG